MARDIYGVPMYTHDVREVIFWKASAIYLPAALVHDADISITVIENILKSIIHLRPFFHTFSIRD